jgi:hypothetical protein
MKFEVSSHRAGYRYSKFAKQMHEENPHLEFTREIVDKAAEDVIRRQRSAHGGHGSATKLLREVSPWKQTTLQFVFGADVLRS